MTKESKTGHPRFRKQMKKAVVKERDALDEIREEYYAMRRRQMYEDQ